MILFAQCISYCSTHQNDLEGLLKHKLHDSKCRVSHPVERGQGADNLQFEQVPGDTAVEAVGLSPLRTTSLPSDWFTTRMLHAGRFQACSQICSVSVISFVPVKDAEMGDGTLS